MIFLYKKYRYFTNATQPWDILLLISFELQSQIWWSLTELVISPTTKSGTTSKMLWQHSVTTQVYPFNFSLCGNIFFICKFPVFSLSGKMKIQIPYSPCALSTLYDSTLVYIRNLRSKWNWQRTTYIVLSNYHNENIDITCWFPSICQNSFTYDPFNPVVK